MSFFRGDGGQPGDHPGRTEMQKADVLLVLGTNLKSFLCSQLTGYYEGDKLIVIDEEDHFSNKDADIFWQSRVDDALGGNHYRNGERQ